MIAFRVPFKDHINIEANAVLEYKDVLVDYKVTPKGMLQIFLKQDIPKGQVFLAVVHSLDELPESEMKEVRLFKELPENLTYPKVSPLLCEEAYKLYVSKFGNNNK